MSTLFWVVVLSLWPFGPADRDDRGTAVPTAHTSSSLAYGGGGGNEEPTKPPPD